MKRKMSGNLFRLMLCLIMVAIFALSYQFIYLEYVDKTEEYKEKTDQTRQLITQRKDELAKADELKAQTEEITKEYNTIIASYPVKITKEDNLIFIEKLEKELKIDIPSVNIYESSDFYQTILPARDENGNELVVDLPADKEGNTATIKPEAAPSQAVINEANNSNGLQDQAVEPTEGNASTGAVSEAGDKAETLNEQFMVAKQSRIDISFQTTNDDFLRVVNYISNYPEKTSITNATLNYDSSTGELLASMTINRYALTGTGKKYDEPDIGKISIGTDNLFGTPSKKKKTAEENISE